MRAVSIGNKLLQTEEGSLVSLKRDKRKKRHKPKPPTCQAKVKEAKLLFWTNFSMKQVNTTVFSFDFNSVGIS